MALERWADILESCYDELQEEADRYESGLRAIIRLGTCDRFRESLFDGCEAFKRDRSCPTCEAEYALRGLALHEIQE